MAGIPQVITEDRASGAQVVEGSLKFDSGKGQYLKRRPTANGNRKLWTWSGWLKRTPGALHDIFSAGQENVNDGLYSRFRIDSDDYLNYRQWVNTSSLDAYLVSSMKLRDPSAYFHYVAIYDSNNSTNSDKVRFYINGQRVTVFSSNDYPGGTNSSWVNDSSKTHTIGGHYDGGSSADSFFNGNMSQVYFIDGQALGPEYFGFTDPLTGTWRPKKFDIKAEVSKNPNNGTTWSSTTDSGLTYADGVTGIFDGNLSTRGGAPSTNNNYAILTNNVSISCTNGIRIYWNGVGSGQRYIRINGTIELDDGSAQLTPGWSPLSSFSGTINKIEVKSASSGSWSLAAIEVDGYILIDGSANNSFYLPMDGKTLIGKDQSGNGNDWTPVKFGGSVTLDNPTVSGAIPILNTNDAGTVAKRGVRTDSKTYTVTASGGNYYLDGALKPTLNAYRGGSYIFDYTGATSHPFYLSSLQDGKHNSKAYSSRLYRSGGYLDLGTGHTDLQPGSGDFCIELYVNLVNQGANYPVFVDTRVSGSTDANGFFWGIRDADNRIYLYSHGGTRIYADHSLTTGKWYHLALTRQSGTFRMFIDGRQVGVSYSQSQNYTNQIRYIGHSTNSEVQTWYIDAYISNFRFVKGEAVYTTNFTPPQTTLTTTSQGVSSSNVKLLCCQDSSPTTAVVSPGTITLGQAGSDAVTSVNTHNPFLYNSVHGNFGVNTATSNTTKITIPHYAADTLYYYCSAHSGMGSSINVTTDIRKADPYAWKCVLANSLVGSANDVSNQINSGTTEKVMTVSGATTNTAGNFYNGSYKFVAASSQEISTPGSSDFAFGTGDFCVECWYYNDTSGGGTTYNQLVGNIESAAEGFWRIGSVFGGNNRFWFTYTNGNYNDVSANVNINDGRWHHLAATREGGSLRLFIDGVVSATATVTQHFSQTTTLRMMYSAQQPGYANGYLQDVRVYKGAAKYTENFVVGSTAPDVLPDTPSGITGKANLTKITEGAVIFDGTGDYLDPPTSSDFGLAGGDNFTIECFVFTSVGNQELIRQGTANAASDGLYFSITSSGALQTRISGTTKTTSGKIAFNSWNHISVCRSGGTLYMSINGVVESHGSVTNSSTTGAFKIGSNFEESSFFTGYVSNVRFVKGTALYTSDFTPPTEPLTEVTNTKLLCCQSNTEPGRAAVSPSISGPNDGTNWSHNVTSDSIFRSGFPGWKAFNGTTKSSTNDCAATPQTAGQGFTFTFGGGVPFTTLQMQCDPNGSSGATVKANGVDITSQLTSGSLTNTTITGVTSPLTSLSLVSRNGDAGYLGSITIDSTMLIDPLSPKGDASATTFNPFTDDINTIRGQASGYATLNPLDVSPSVIANRGTTLSEGNLTSSVVSGADNKECVANISATSGKYYYEVMFNPGANSSNSDGAGWVADDGLGVDNSTAGGFMMIARDVGSTIVGNGSSRTNESAGTHPFDYYPGDVMGCAIDLDSRIATWYKNGQKHSFVVDFSSRTNLNGLEFKPLILNRLAGSVFANFGQKPFKFPPPDGFQPLNISNVQPEKVFARPEQYVDVSLWSGNGTSQDIAGLKHKPDLVWIKKRSGGSARSHQLFDSVRGVFKTLHSDSTNTEDNNTNRLTAFNQDGFAVGGDDGCNGSGGEFVAWTWKAGGNNNTFNIDDVGYANASDVNMNVGVFNSSAFLKGQVWSGLMSVASGTFDQAASRAFNGVLDTDPNRLRTSDNQALVTMTLSTPVTVSSQIKVHAEPGYNSSCTVTVGGVTYTSSTGALHTFNVSGSLTEMTLQSTQSGGRTYMEGMEIDGKLLVDDNVTANSPSIAPTSCSVGTKQGFSIVKWTGDGSNANRTVPHGLLEAPSFIIVKPLTESRHWLIWHKGYNDDDAAMLFDTGIPAGSRFGPQSPNSNVFGVYGGQGNRGTTDFIGYCWHDVPGLQKFGTYTGNGNANGPFIELGFKPAIFWMKAISGSSANWVIIDSKRPGYNPDQKTLCPNLSNAENASGATTNDILSNGFKVRGTTDRNASGVKYIYCAWAEAPSVNLYGAQANAR